MAISAYCVAAARSRALLSALRQQIASLLSILKALQLTIFPIIALTLGQALLCYHATGSSGYERRLSKRIIVHVLERSNQRWSRLIFSIWNRRTAVTATPYVRLRRLRCMLRILPIQPCAVTRLCTTASIRHCAGLCLELDPYAPKRLYYRFAIPALFLFAELAPIHMCSHVHAAPGHEFAVMGPSGCNEDLGTEGTIAQLGNKRAVSSPPIWFLSRSCWPDTQRPSLHNWMHRRFWTLLDRDLPSNRCTEWWRTFHGAQ